MLSPSDTNPNADISLNDALNKYSGSFVFAPVAPNFTTATQANTFVSQVQAWLLSTSSVLGQYCVWLVSANPLVFGAPSFSSGNGKYFAFSYTQQTSGLTLQTNFNAYVGINVFLSVPIGIILSYSKSADCLFLQGFLSPFITINCPSALSFSNSPNQAYIPFAGNSAGCLVVAGNLTITPSANNIVLGMQFAYGSPNAADTVQPFPLLNLPNQESFPYIASFDPVDPLCVGAASNPGNGIYRTIVTLSCSGETCSLASQFCSSSNQPVAFLPQSSGTATAGPNPYDAGFIFQPTAPLVMDPTNLLPKLTVPYMAPVGNYQVSVPGVTTPFSLLCGLAGTETLQLQPAGGSAAPDVLSFIAASPTSAPAYTPVFPLPTADLSTPSTGLAAPTLPPATAGSTVYLTSWVKVIPGAGNSPTYSAQPQGNPLFGKAGPYGDGASIVGALQPVTPIGPVIFPLVPWAGVAPPSANQIPTSEWSDYESKVLSATRRNAIQSYARPQVAAIKKSRAALALTATAPPIVTPNGTTPQGLLAQIDSSSGHTIYDAVILAQSEVQDANSDPQMAFLDMSTELQGLFQTNQLFAVITNCEYVGTAENGKFANTVDIAGWTMQINVGSTAGSSNVSNVLILKYCVGALTDLVAKPSAWVDPTDFSNPDPSTGVAILSQALQEYFASAIAEANSGNTLYQNFARIVTDPNWQGVLALAADMTPEDLPPQLAGLAAGINFSQFRAHHFGVTISPVQYDGTNFSIPGTSSFFGLVDYQLPAYIQNVAAGGSPTQPLALPVSGDYNFTVLQLQSLFINSAIVDFKSHVQVTINVVCGSTVTASYSSATLLPANAVVLTGYYQSQGDTGTYLFESNATTVMVPDSNVLDAFVITKVLYNTLTDNDGATPPNILSRILIWGSLDFALLTNSTTKSVFDLMSYGMPGDTAPEKATGGLAFSNLHIDMSSPVATPNVTTYTIVETDMVFDQAGSLLRTGSAVKGLVLQPQKFLTAPAGATPATQGFLPVMLTTGGPSQMAVSQEWYGISCLINMGGPGALASAAGFTSQMLLAWSPQSNRSATSFAAFAGLQLPGASPGASAFSLQGVIQLTVGNISLSYAPINNGAKDPPNAFNLCLADIAVSFLGVVKMPSSASIDMFLFGDPQGTGSLGWYAAYVENTSSASADETNLLSREEVSA